MNHYFAVVILALGIALCPTQSAGAQASRPPWNVDLGDGVTMPMRWIPPGTFVMGSEQGPEDERPLRRVALTSGFWMCQYEVTQEQFLALTARNPSTREGDKHPVEKVSWEDAHEFIEELNLLNAAPRGLTFRLPTEAEWEYACRGGTRTRYYTGDDAAALDRAAWHDGNSGFKHHPVGQQAPNAYGLYDMLGNVSEWCYDWSGKYAATATINPFGPPDAKDRVVRGGSFADVPERMTVSFRRGIPPQFRYGYNGFRVVCGVNYLPPPRKKP
jgi:formylglycine-generating enzyme required for sulfatase activity